MTSLTKTKDIVIKGSKIYLRLVTLEDATPEYLSWLNDVETTKYLELHYRGEYTMEMLRSDIERYNADESVKWYAICTKDDTHIGNIKIEGIDWNHGFGELGILIGSDYWNRGYGTEAVKLICRHMFDSYWLRRICAGYFDDNKGSRSIFQKNGFEAEGALVEHRWSPSIEKWVDECRVALRNPKK